MALKSHLLWFRSYLPMPVGPRLQLSMFLDVKRPRRTSPIRECVEDPLAHGFARFWSKLHPCLRAALAGEGYPLGDYADAQALADESFDATVQQTILTQAAGLLPPDGKGDSPETLRFQLERLLVLAKRVPGLARCSHAYVHEPTPPGLLAKMELCTKGIPGKQLTKWRSYKRRNLAAKSSTGMTVRQIEAELAKRWKQRLIQRVAPYAASLPRLEEALKSTVDDSHLDVFGPARWSTLAQHGRNLEAMMVLMPELLPWTTTKVANLFDNMSKANSLRDKPWSPGKPNGFWKTIHYLHDKLDGRDLLDIPYLKCKKDGVRARMVTSYETEDHRAKVPPMEVVEALERMSVSALLWLDRFFASGLRHILGASGRFNDYIHTHPGSFAETDKTVELSAWQTKVTDLLDNKRPMPLICPKVSFTGPAWWLTFVEGLKHLKTLLPDRDFIFPAPSKDRHGVRDEPLRNAKALDWYRTLLREAGLEETLIKSMTLSGLRVYMPEMAYRIQIPRDQRRYLGRWASDSMADVYTREHREIIVKIWQEVQAKLGCTTTPPPSSAPVPVNLSASFYDLDEREMDRPQLPTVHLDDIEAVTEGMTDVSLEHDPRPALPPRGEYRNRETNRKYINTVTVAEGGPIALITNKFPTGKPAALKAHLCYPTRQCVCGYKPNVNKIDRWKNKIETSQVAEWNATHASYEACWTCFRQYTLPPDWLDPPYDAKHQKIVDNERQAIVAADSDGTSDLTDSSSTDQESDTDADTGAIPTISSGQASAGPTTTPAALVAPVPTPPGLVWGPVAADAEEGDLTSF